MNYIKYYIKKQLLLFRNRNKINQPSKLKPVDINQTKPKGKKTMNYIKISNLGTFDVPMSVNLLGASVKGKDDAIGMFGSGLKYALAQAMREGFSVHITSGDNMYKIITTPVRFKNATFEKVCLEDITTGEIFETPITTAFGQENWTDKWFIYREIISNAMDEDCYKLTTVKHIRRSPVETCIYLSMDDFRDIYDDHKQYFCENKDDWVKKGSGIVYKKGVRIGQLMDCKLDFQFNFVSIDESRQMDDWSARNGLASIMSGCMNLEVWTSFFNSEIKNQIYINIHDKDVGAVAKSAIKSQYGDFAMCPDDVHIKKDVESMGVHPFVTSENWKFPEGLMPNFKEYLSSDNESLRPPNNIEQELISWGLGLAENLGMEFSGEVLVIMNNAHVSGLASFTKGNICLNETLFDNKAELLKTIFHEIGHIDSGHSDWERGFADYFIGKMVANLMIKE
jgi:hypothetical protein